MTSQRAFRVAAIACVVTMGAVERAGIAIMSRTFVPLTAGVNACRRVTAKSVMILTAAEVAAELGLHAKIQCAHRSAWEGSAAATAAVGRAEAVVTGSCA